METTEFGGTNGNGTVFAVNTNGAGFAAPYNFNPVIENGFAIPTNYGGANPAAGLVLSGNTLFGTANGVGSYNRQSGDGGGIYGGGTVFALTRRHEFELESDSVELPSQRHQSGF